MAFAAKYSALLRDTQTAYITLAHATLIAVSNVSSCITLASLHNSESYCYFHMKCSSNIVVPNKSRDERSGVEANDINQRSVYSLNRV